MVLCSCVQCFQPFPNGVFFEVSHTVCVSMAVHIKAVITA